MQLAHCHKLNIDITKLNESWGIYLVIKQLEMYLYGLKFNIITDHQPLVTLFSAGAKSTPLTVKLVIRLMSYYFKKCQSGMCNSADFLSWSNLIQQNKPSSLF